MTDLKNLLGENIRHLRKLRKWTQADLAEKAGIEPVTIARIETGQNFPKGENISAIARVFNVEISDLFSMKEEAPNKEITLNYIHYSIHNLEDRDLKIVYNMIKTMLSC